MTIRSLTALLITTALLLTGCGNGIVGSDDFTPTTQQEREQDQTQTQDTDQETDRDRDRDRIHQVLAATLDACGEQDRDRLRDTLQTRLRTQVDEAGYRYGEGARFVLVDEDATFDGDGAVVRARIRVEEQNGETSEVEVQWRFQSDGTGEWQLADVPLCLDTSTTPSTLRDQVRDQDCAQGVDCDQDQDRDQVRDQERDQDCARDDDCDQDQDRDRDRDRDRDG